MIFDAYSGKDLHNFISILQQFKHDGINDVHTMTKAVSDYLDTSILNQQKTVVSRKTEKSCPHCGSAMSCGMVIDGLEINGCRNCRYSEIE